MKSANPTSEYLPCSQLITGCRIARGAIDLKVGLRHGTKANTEMKGGAAAQPQPRLPSLFSFNIVPSTTHTPPHARPTQNLAPFARSSHPSPQRRISRLPPATRSLHCLTMSNKDFYGGGPTQYPPQAYQPPPGPPPGQGGYYPPPQGYGYPPQGGYQQQQPMYVQQQGSSGGGGGATGCLAW